MLNPVQIETPTVASREAERSQLANSLVFELQRNAALVQAALVDEENRVEIRDPAHAGYPMLARLLRNRFDNLQKTISYLQSAAA